MNPRFASSRKAWVVLWSLLILGAASLIVLVSLSRDVSSGFATVEDQHTAQERTDCARLYNAVLTEWTEDRVIVSAYANLRLGKALIEGRRGIQPTDDDIAGFAFTIAIADTVDRIINDLPSLSQMVEEGATVDGKRYPPCPRVEEE